jgi:hypothetical protein
MGGAARGPASPAGVAVSLPYFVSPSDSVNVSEKGTLAFVSSNSENISFSYNQE